MVLKNHIGQKIRCYSAWHRTSLINIGKSRRADVVSQTLSLCKKIITNFISYSSCSYYHRPCWTASYYHRPCWTALPKTENTHHYCPEPSKKWCHFAYSVMDYLLDPDIHALMGSMSGRNCWVCTISGMHLTHWPQGDAVISKVLSLNTCYRLSLCELVKLSTYIYMLSSSIVVRNHVSHLTQKGPVIC